MSTKHAWNFVRLGGLDQVIIRTAEDLLNLKDLDQKLWVALACPVKGLEIDEKTLALIDRDNDGRIRVPELLEAIRWASLHLKDVSYLLKGSDTLPLEVINAGTPDGQGTLASVKTILRGLGKADATSVSLAEAADTVKLFASTTLNGDGVITPSTAGDDAEAKQIIADILATVGGTPDRSGQPGIDQGRADTFYNACAACVGWIKKGHTPEVLTLGADTAAASAAVKAVRAKVDDYFARVRLAAFDERALAALNRSESEYLAIVAQELSANAEEVSGFPLARVALGKALPLLSGVNPAWAGALATLQKDAVAVVYGADVTDLTEARWEELKAKVAAYDAWLASKAGDVVEKLGPERIEAILADTTRERINALIAADKALEPEFNAIHGVERLARYCRDFGSLLSNFVNFLEFYSPETPAAFQAGVLYLDTRATELCIEVTAPTPLAAMSKMFIAYCDLKRPGRPPRKIAACFTNGDSDFLFVGRNGLFYDRKGLDWDATIVALADSPISIRQAFFAPYKKFVRLVEEQIAKRAAAADADANAKLAAAAEKTANADKSGAKPAEAKKVDIGTVAAMGVAVGAIGGALGAIATGLAKLSPLQLPLVPIGLMLIISGPSMLIAWLKLRQRTIGPILEANGWAINGRIKINIPFGTKLTERARLPKGSHLDLTDPYEDKAASRRRRIVTVVVVALAVLAGLIRWDAVRHGGHYFWQDPAPAAAPQTPPPEAAK